MRGPQHKIPLDIFLFILYFYNIQYNMTVSHLSVSHLSLSHLMRSGHTCHDCFFCVFFSNTNTPHAQALLPFGKAPFVRSRVVTRCGNRLLELCLTIRPATSHKPTERRAKASLQSNDTPSGAWEHTCRIDAWVPCGGYTIGSISQRTHRAR